MINTIEGRTANDVWSAALEKFRERSSVRIQPSRAGGTRELLHTIFTIKNPRQRWLTIRNPPINPAFAIAEVIWILNGRNDANFLLYWNRQLSQYAGNSLKYHGAYGYRLRRHLSLDQLERSWEALQKNPNSRQVVLQIWDGNLDLPNADGSPRDADIPCNLLSLLKVRDDKLEWTQILRSNDLFLGVPYNFIQFTTIQEIVAGWLGIEPGHYHHFSDSLHIYERDLEAILLSDFSETFSEEPNLDSLALPKRESDSVLRELEEAIELLISDNLFPGDLEGLVRKDNLPAAYQNLLLLVASEAARRRGWNDLTEGIMWGCTNPILIQSWLKWFSRFKRGEHEKDS